jgi:hypothetical protein
MMMGAIRAHQMAELTKMVMIGALRAHQDGDDGRTQSSSALLSGTHSPSEAINLRLDFS